MSTDSFDPTQHHKDLKLTANNCIVRKIRNNNWSYSAVYLSKTVNSGIHKWRFKILSKQSGGSMMIGIWKSRNLTETNSNIGIKGKSYSYCVTDACLSKGDYGNDYHSNNSYKSARRCKEGAIIEMTLNANIWTLSFMSNNKDHGVAFKIEKTSYKAVVCIGGYGGIGNSFELISYSNDDDVINMNQNDDYKCNQCEIFKERIKENELRINDLERDKNKSIKIIKELQCENAQKTEKVKGLKLENGRIKEKYIKLQKENISLNEECKEMNIKYNKVLKTKILDKCEWREWDYQLITQWIINLNSEYKEFEDTLCCSLKTEEIDGTMLPDLDKSDLHRFGIILMKNKLFILKQIKILTNKQQKNKKSPQIAQNNEGNITAFI